MTPELLIPDAEYQERRHVADMCRWIDKRLSGLEASNDFDQRYFTRRGSSLKRSDRSLKKLIEEAIPVSRLGLWLWRPGCDVLITCFSGNESYDAEIEVGGFTQRRFRVEVTTTETTDSTQRRQALARDGHVALTGPFGRNPDGTIAEPEMIDVAEDDEQRIDLAISRLQGKLESGQTDAGTAVLVYLTEGRPIRHDFRANLVRRTAEHLRTNRPSVYAVCFCYCDYQLDYVPWQVSPRFGPP